MEDSEWSEEHGEENLYFLRYYRNHHKKTVGSNMDTKSTTSEGVEGNEEHVNMENGGKGIDHYY